MSGVAGSTSKGENATDNWQTPTQLVFRVQELGAMLGFEEGVTLDPCTVKSNPVGAEHIRTPDCEPDGLATEWWSGFNDRFVYVNPPYRQKWYDKIMHEATHRPEMSHLVCLLPAKPGTGYFQSMAAAAQAVVFIRGRVTFHDPDTGAPRMNGKTGKPDPATFESALLYYGRKRYVFLNQFADMGWAV